MLLRKIFFVSHAKLAGASIDRPLEEICAASLARNAALQITGALIHSGGYFAQVFEGPPDAVCAVMTSIQADPRHTHVSVLEDGPAQSRVFSTWSLAFAHPSLFIFDQVGIALRNLDGGTTASSNLERFMLGMAQS